MRRPAKPRKPIKQSLKKPQEIVYVEARRWEIYVEEECVEYLGDEDAAFQIFTNMGGDLDNGNMDCYIAGQSSLTYKDVEDFAKMHDLKLEDVSINAMGDEGFSNGVCVYLSASKTLSKSELEAQMKVYEVQKKDAEKEYRVALRKWEKGMKAYKIAKAKYDIWVSEQKLKSLEE